MMSKPVGISVKLYEKRWKYCFKFSLFQNYSWPFSLFLWVYNVCIAFSYTRAALESWIFLSWKRFMTGEYLLKMFAFCFVFVVLGIESLIMHMLLKDCTTDLYTYITSLKENSGVSISVC